MLYVIGCGGVGSWLVPKLGRMGDDLCLIDGDTLEMGNLDRQLFDRKDVGSPKSEALGKRYKIRRYIADYFSAAMSLGLNSSDILFCCADNHACRRAVIDACDRADCRCVIGANEYEDFEAYWYERDWKGTPNDPREFYPSILSDHSGDPLAPEGCTGSAVVAATPQLVIANSAASEMMAWLYWFHLKVRPTLDAEQTRPFWPVMHKGNQWAMKTIRYGDRLGACRPNE